MAEPDIRILVSNTGDASPDGKSASKIRDNLQKAFNSKPAYLKVEMHSKSANDIRTALQNVKIKASLAPDTQKLLQQQLDVLSRSLKLNLSATVGNANIGVPGAQGSTPFSNFDGAAVSTKAMSQATAELTKNRISNANAMAQENLRAQEQINDLKIQAAESRAVVAAIRAQEAQSRANANAKSKEAVAIDKNNKAQSDSNKLLAQFNEYLTTLRPKALTEFGEDIAKIRDLLGKGMPESLQKAKNSLNDFKADMKNLGYEGGNVFTYLQDKVRTFATYLVSSTLTIGVVSTFSDVVNTVEDLDAALTDLQIVTGGTNAETKELLSTYNKMAQELGSTTADVASGATDWLRQGYNKADSAELLRQSMTLSIVGDMNSADATNALTAAMKGYQLAVEDASSVVDKFFKVDMAAATSSSDMAEALAKTAANAKLAGISLDDVIGQLAVVNETLKEDGSSTGTFYNTMLSRMSAIKSGRLVDPETEESISDVETTLNRLGIALRDSDGQFRNLGEVLDEVGERWENFGSTSQRAIATAFAGTRQQTRFLALMAGWDQASKYAEEAANSTGLASEKLGIYQESIAAKQAKMTAAFESFSQTLLNSDLVALVYDIGAGFLNFAASANPTVVSIVEITTAIAGAAVAFNALKASSIGASFKKSGEGLSAIISNINAYGIALTSTISSADEVEDFLTTMGNAITNLNESQLKNIVATRGMSKELLESALKHANVDDELKKTIISHYEAATAKTVDSAATKSATLSMEAFTAGLWANIKAMATWMITNPVGQIMLIAGAFGVAKTAADKFGLSAEGAAKKFKESQSSYNSTVNELGQVSSELKSIRDRISELDSLSKSGRLTPDQEAELKDLKTTNSELDRKKKMLENIARVQQEAADNAAGTLYAKTTYSSVNTDFDAMEGKEISTRMNGIEYMRDLMAGMREIEKAKAEIESTLSNNAELTSNEISRAKSELDKLSKTYNEYEKELSHVIPEQREIADSINSAEGPLHDIKLGIYEVIDAWNKLSDSGNAPVSGLSSSVAKDVANLKDHLSALGELESKFKSLSDALGEFRDDKIVSVGTLVDLQSVFGDLSGFEKFANVVGNSKSTFEQVRAACNSLAEEYINNKVYLGDLTEETKEMTIAELKNIGVTNAASIVNAELAAQRVNAKVAALDHANATYTDVAALYDEAIKATSDTTAIQRLRYEKINGVAAGINFANANATVIASLISEANAAGIAASKISALIELERMKSQIGTGGLTGTEYRERIEYLSKKASQQIKNAKAELISFSGVTIKPPKVTGSNSEKTTTKTSDELKKEKFEELYKQQKHLLDMEKITTQQFYNWLTNSQNGYMAYFKKNTDEWRKYEKEAYDLRKTLFEESYSEKKHQLEMEKISTQEFYDWLVDSKKGYMAFFKKNSDEFEKYEKEAFDLRKELADNYLASIDDEIAALERQDDSEALIIARYREKQNVIKDLMDVHIAYLKSIGATDAAIADNSSLAELLKSWWEIQDSIDDIANELNNDLADGMQNLLDMTISMVKIEKEEEKEALEAQKDSYQKIIDMRREMLKMSEQERQYQDEVAEKNSELEKIEARIAALRADDSREAAVERGALEEQRAELQKELANLQNDHWLDSVDSALEKELEDWTAQQDEKIESIENMLDDEVKLTEVALSRLDDMNQTLFDDLLSYAINYCDMSRYEFEEMWDAALAAAEKYGSYINAMESVPGDDKETEASKIIKQMDYNRVAWAAATTDAEREYYSNQSLKLGERLAAVTGEKVYRDAGGYWWIGDEYLFDYGTGTGNADSSISKKNAAKVSEIVSEMKGYSRQWNRNDPEGNKFRGEIVSRLAKDLEKYGVFVEFNPGSGKWIITQDNNDSSKRGKWLYEVYHSGGVVGIPTPKQNEQLSLLEHGELVLTQSHQDVLDKILEYGKKFSQIPSTVAGMFNTNNNSRSIEINAPLYFSGEMSDSKILSVLKKHGRTIANEVAKVYGV